MCLAASLCQCKSFLMNPCLLHRDLFTFLYLKLCVVCVALPALVPRAVKGDVFLFLSNIWSVSILWSPFFDSVALRRGNRYFGCYDSEGFSSLNFSVIELP